MARPPNKKSGLPGDCDETTESCSSPPPVPTPAAASSPSRSSPRPCSSSSGSSPSSFTASSAAGDGSAGSNPLLAAEAANPGVEGGGHVVAAPAPGVEGGGPEQGGGEEAVHHAWHIRTVGLDEAAIESIALTRYRAGAGMLGAADCSVCLGEFRDGELLRLLPKCGHAFHVPCVDTWLRAHVNCPLCRADVLDPDAAAGDSDPPAGANAGTVAEEASSNIDETLDHEQAGPGQQQNEQQELRVQIDQRDHPSSPEPLHRHPGSQVQKFRRVASMDSSLAPAMESPEDELNSKEKQGNGGDTACFKVSSGSGRSHLMKRSLSGGGRWSLASRHCRTRSSVLPL